jgi:hypothetical protein
MKTHTANTYDLIVESEVEDKNRTAIETVIYVLFILSAVVSIWHSAVQPVVLPSTPAGFVSDQSATVADCRI